jgi:hypothetical protein
LREKPKRYSWGSGGKGEGLECGFSYVFSAILRNLFSGNDGYLGGLTKEGKYFSASIPSVECGFQSKSE